MGALCLQAGSVAAQRTFTQPTNYDYINQELSHKRSRMSTSGSPLLLPQWSLGQVRLRNGNVQANQWLKYDLARETVMCRRPQGDSIELFSTLISGFSLRDSAQHYTYTYRLYPEIEAPTPAMRAVFFDVRYDHGQLALLRRTQRRTVSRNTSSSLTSTASMSWQTEAHYFLKLPNNQLKPVRLAPKSLLETLPEPQQTAAAAYVKSQSLDLRQEPDVIRLLAYCDGLTATGGTTR